jgi:hypothetical protein
VPRALVLFLLISYIISPKEEIITFLFCDCPELDEFLVMGQSMILIANKLN